MIVKNSLIMNTRILTMTLLLVVITENAAIKDGKQWPPTIVMIVDRILITTPTITACSAPQLQNISAYRCLVGV